MDDGRGLEDGPIKSPLSSTREEPSFSALHYAKTLTLTKRTVPYIIQGYSTLRPVYDTNTSSTATSGILFFLHIVISYVLD